MIINVLLRGRSLSEFNTLGPADIVFLANDTDVEIQEVKGLKEYLSDKEIYLVFNMVKEAANGYHRMRFFETYNVTKLIRPYVEGDREPGSSEQNINLPDIFLGEHHKDFMYRGGKYSYDYPGTGIAAIAYAILDCKADVLNIVGLDFYDNLNQGKSNYLVGDNAGRDYATDLSTNTPPGPELESYQHKIQNTLCDLVEHRPDMEVNLITKCKTFIDRIKNIDNLNITKVGDRYEYEPRKLWWN